MKFVQEISVFNPRAIEDQVISMNSSIQQTADQIALRVEIQTLVETMNSQLLITGKKIELTTGHFTITADNINVTEAGDVTITGAINAIEGKIGSSISSGKYWNIGGDEDCAWIYSGSKSSIDSSSEGVYIGTDGIEMRKSTGENAWTRIKGGRLYTTWLTLYDNGGTKEASAVISNETTGIHYSKQRIQFSNGIVTSGRNLESSDNLFINHTILQGGYSDGSDRRIKRDISRIDTDSAKEFIKRLIPSKYRFLNRVDTHLWHHGFVAQDVEPIAWDGLVSGKGDELKCISYNEIIADVVAVLQYLLDKEDGENG